MQPAGLPGGENSTGRGIVADNPAVVPGQQHLQLRLRQRLHHFLRLVAVQAAEPVVLLQVRQHQIRMLLLEGVANHDAVEDQRTLVRQIA